MARESGTARDMEDSLCETMFHLEKTLGVFIHDEYPWVKLIAQSKEFERYTNRKQEANRRGSHR